MALPDLVTLEVKQGDRAGWVVTVTEDDESPIDLTGWTWEWSAAKKRRATTPFWTFTEADTDRIDVSDASDGVIRLALLPEDSRAFGSAAMVEFELTGTAPGTNGEGRLSILDGQINVRLEVAS